MGDYDNILKVKKREDFEDSKIEDIKKFPKFSISFVLILIVLIVSYVIYYNNVLSPSNIIVNNYNEVFNKYFKIIKNIPLTEFMDENNLNGTILYKEDEFKFNLIKNQNNYNFNISNNDRFINYYSTLDKSYSLVNGINEYVIIPKLVFDINNLSMLKDNLSKIDSNKFIKSLYLVDKRPVVEVNLTLNTVEINDIFGFNLVDDCEVIISLRNDAIMNELVEFKIIFNNKSTLERKTITFLEDKILYKVGEDNYKLVLTPNNDNFMIKINKNDDLYSILSGVVSEDSYRYDYKVINSNYSISVITTKIDNSYTYDIIKKKDDLEMSLNINLNIENGYMIETGENGFIDKDNELIKETYLNEINYFRDKFSYFID